MPKTRSMTIIAKDPSATDTQGNILKAQVQIPHEKLDDGPRGYRVHVVDYDSSQRILYEPAKFSGAGGPSGNAEGPFGDDTDPFVKASNEELVSNPTFHAQNVYATVMKQLARFEFALGRRISWGFKGHQLYVSPHAFADQNAYYSEENRSLLFGYFGDGKGGNVFTCLSHDIVAHESTHALLSGLRNNYTRPSSPDQAAFHEGFSDIVALLSVFGTREVVRQLLAETSGSADTVAKSALTIDSLRTNALECLAGQFGQVTSAGRQRALRNAAATDPDPGAYRNVAFEECHLRGEILSGAVMRAFISVWHARLQGWVPWVAGDTAPIDRVVEDASDAAEHLLTMSIRALDYCPVVDIQFGDFLSALLTADYELVPDDGKYKYRDALRGCFNDWGIRPSSGAAPPLDPNASDPLAGIWETPPGSGALSCDCVHRECLERDPDEVFRFIWENRTELEIYENAYTQVTSVRPCVRVGYDGFVLRETVSEYIQMLEINAGQLGGLPKPVTKPVTKPDDMPDDTPVRLLGGGVLVFDEFGRLKYHVRNRIDNAALQARRLEYLWDNKLHDSSGRYGFTDGMPRGMRFAITHLRSGGQLQKGGGWDD